MKKVKSIKQLYEEVKNNDLVITNDAPLNTALSKLNNKTTLGSFALTSRLIGSKYAMRIFEEEIFDLSQIVLYVKNKLNFSLKKSLHHCQNIFNIYQYTGNLNEIKNYISKDEIDILNIINDLPTYQKAMEISNLNFLNKTNIAVIGEDLFSNLDKKVLKNKYKKIEIFEDKKTKLDTIYQFNSIKDIVDRVVSMITKENQDHVAITLNIQSEYLSLIKAKLINKKINLNEKIYLFQDFRVREFISILEILFSNHNSKTIDLIPIGNIFNISIDESLADYDFLELVNINKNAKNLSDLLIKLKKQTFENLFIILKKNKINLPEELLNIINKLNLTKEQITLNKINELKYFIENFDIQINTNKNGVLLVDCKNSSFINRDIIFYIGIDHLWTRIEEDKEYFDKKEELNKNIIKFQILIQQGVERFFFINKLTNKETTIPPFYFSFIFDKKIKSYDNSIFNIISIKNKEEKIIFKKKNLFKKIEKFSSKSSFSNSALSSYIQCPKKYSYSQILFSTQKDYFIKGELVHSFAEFYIENKKFVKKKGIKLFLKLIMNELKYLTIKSKREIEETKIKFACETIIKFIDKLEINNKIIIKSNLKTNMKKINFFAKYFKKKSSSLNAEVEFRDIKLKLNGVIDLLVNDSLIVDYKTSKKKSAKDIFKNSDINFSQTHCDFQPLVYLSIFRKFSKNKELLFKYLFPMINTYNKLMNLELENDFTNVHYIPKKFIDFFLSKEFYREIKLNGPKYSKAIVDVIEDFSYFKNKKISIEMLNNPKLFAETFEKEFTIYLLDNGMKPTKLNKENVFKTLKVCFQMRIAERYGQKEVFFFKDQIDIFEKFIIDNLEELNKNYKTKFEFKPIQGTDTCDNCDFKSICLKLGVEKIK